MSHNKPCTETEYVSEYGSDRHSEFGSTIIGELIGVNENGEPLVFFMGLADGSSLVALNALSADDVASIQSFPVKVTITFEAEKTQPVILGLVKNTLFSMDVLAREKVTDSRVVSDQVERHVSNVSKAVSNKPNALYTEIDGKKIILSGKEEILLKCGKSSILMRRDGKIVIKGDDITSRSSSRNKIKGSSVSIN